MRLAESFTTVRDHTFYFPGLRPQPTILDLGANRGAFSKEMEARFGGQYYLVEANPRLADLLRAEGRHRVWHCALANSEGTITFNIARNDEGSSILKLPSDSIHNSVLDTTVQVPAKRLQSLLEEIKAPTIDLMKVDIEGAEFMVLRDLPSTSLSRIGQMSVEFHADPAFGFNLQEELADVLNYFRKNDFLILDFSGQTRRDVLFINLRIHNIPKLTQVQWSLRKNPPRWLYWIWKRLPSRSRALFGG